MSKIGNGGKGSEVLRSFFSYQVADGKTISEYRQVVDILKSRVPNKSTFPGHLDKEKDVVASPILHDTPGEMAQATDVKAWFNDEPGQSSENFFAKPL
jgi:nitrate reductase alpha subunit